MNSNSVMAFRLEKAEEALSMAKLAIEKKFWSSAGSRLYYTCFYLVTALLVKHNIRTHTHAGVINVFGLQFIKEGKVEGKWGKLLANLFSIRQEADYGDFAVLNGENLLPLLTQVEEFKTVILKLIEE